MTNLFDRALESDMQRQIDRLKATLAAAREEVARLDEYAELGRILLRYIDRLNDPTQEDQLEKIVQLLLKDTFAAINATREEPKT